MTHMKSVLSIAGVAAVTGTLLVLAPSVQASDYRTQAIEMMKRDFKATGQAGMDRLDEDDVQAACNTTNNGPSGDTALKLQQAQMAMVKLPADGNYMGDWREGEKTAQSGRGFTWSDKPDAVVGGNCYNCHQLSPTETSFGTIGPSLYQYGKLRGDEPDIQKTLYSQIYNAKAFNLCSNMPRFGHVGALNEEQIKNLVALLLDPESPVNSK